MPRWHSAVSLLALMIPAAFYSADQAQAANCEGLKDIKLPNVTIASALSVPANSFVPPAGTSPALRPIGNALPAFCRVTGAIEPVPGSDIGFEVWLPSDGWNGNFLSAGEGGEAGYIFYPGMAMAIRRGYASASTDTGHSSQPPLDIKAYYSKHFVFDWAVGHPEKVIDFAYRAKHLQTVVAKAIIKAYYGTPPKHALFDSCSNGGRQGMMEAQKFPADYDGIIAGAPDIYWYHALVLGIWNEQALVEKPGSRIPPSKLPAIQAAALGVCDATGDETDGLVESPQRCRFDPATLLCKGADANTCLTAAQVTAVRKIVDGARTSDGTQIYTGFNPEYADALGNWATWITGSTDSEGVLFQVGNGFFGNYVFHDANWDFRSFNFDRDFPMIEATLGHDLNAGNPDLTEFKARGGKLIIYQGWADQMVVPGITMRYYRDVMKKMGTRKTLDFARLFMAPGMMHCGGGVGPNSFGQGYSPSASTQDSEHDIVTALEQWVEHGIAPKSLIATKFANDDPGKSVLRTHLLCPYPQIARNRVGRPSDDARNSRCVEPAGGAKSDSRL